MLILSTDEAADTLRTDIEAYRDALEILSVEGTNEYLERAHTLFEVDPDAAYWHVRMSGGHEAMVQALWLVIHGHDRFFKETGSLATLCDATNLNLETVRAQLRADLELCLVPGGLYDVNLFQYRAMADYIVDRIHERQH